MTRRRKRTPFGNHPGIVIAWWIFNVAWFAGCIWATVWLARLLVALILWALTTTPQGANP